MLEVNPAGQDQAHLLHNPAPGGDDGASTAVFASPPQAPVRLLYSERLYLDLMNALPICKGLYLEQLGGDRTMRWWKAWGTSLATTSASLKHDVLGATVAVVAVSSPVLVSSCSSPLIFA